MTTYPPITDVPLRPSPVPANMDDLAIVTETWLKANQDAFAFLVSGVMDRDRDIGALRGEVDRLTALLNTPEVHEFAGGVVRESAHQRERWSTDHDAGKTPEDWLFLVGYLAGKACRGFAMSKAYRELLDGNSIAVEDPGVRRRVEEMAQTAYEKGLHHLITTAAACANWHLHATGVDTRMRPGKSEGGTSVLMAPETDFAESPSSDRVSISLTVTSEPRREYQAEEEPEPIEREFQITAAVDG
jgi:hypothetical protein